MKHLTNVNGDVLDQRMDDALRRIFAMPGGVEHRIGRTRVAARPHAVWRFLVPAAAAALLGLGLWVARSRSPSVVGTESPLAFEPPTVFCSAVGPMEDPLLDPNEMRSPDLARLYWSMDACQRSSAVSCGAEDRLAERLEESYGQDMELRPEAIGLLHGPFGSPEWPTGTILTGFPENKTSVLVAERDSTLTCCMRMQLPESSGLRLFTWRVGGLVLTEITPLAEPRLIACFE